MFCGTGRCVKNQKYEAAHPQNVIFLLSLQHCERSSAQCS
ncbi:hypothetical protein HMPREF1991_01656 [Hoylesella loescheii DSM 19665 = JCM 12249 = ATCC 15930]|uniref:Uncharacterized protein n=1 Tax=Hoylesella loescheii DSM 19665 = JCM 12249 = ATCC 15930 TaxID=1122985 RepID=A0A069QQX3_HOYLO|nr:hypothetical protein HMPREF1991_01656 [Hoylesella loescheii DSM 19665 = JCM 12249 = ATCC 15930]